MEGNIKIFVRTSIIILGAFAALLAGISVAYAYATLTAYNIILISLIALLGLSCLMLLAMSLAIVLTFVNRKSEGLRLLLTRAGMQVMLPLALVFSKADKRLRKSIRLLYIELNNIVVECENKKYNSSEVMLLLPHCLQNSQCGLKVTSNPEVCKRCGKCKIGELLDYTAKKNISVYIATGGTVARKVIKENSPRLIISVACERDLMSGILDVRGIPVIGVVNRQPCGPCFNTDVELSDIRKRVEQLTY